MDEGTQIHDHLNIFHDLIFQLFNLDVKLDEEDKEVALLCSLPESWDPLIAST